MRDNAEAKRLFNETWNLLDAKTRTPDEDALMLLTAHTSCYLWREAESPLADARGAWQVSHVYSTLGFGGPALLFATRSLRLCNAHALGAFDLCFAYEAVAMAQILLGQREAATENLASAKRAASEIADEADQTWSQTSLATIEALLSAPQ